MSATPQPTAGYLEARIIRACTVHKTCPLSCKQRRVEELGRIASFDVRPSFIDRLKEVYRGIARP